MPDTADTRLIAAASPFRRECLLLVEDDPDIAAMVAGMLTDRGYEVRTAPDGSQLERVLHAGGVDLVILDLMLPGEDGLSLCHRLRARYGVPMLMLTALAATADRIVGLESGADDYLVKPFAPRELVARIRALLRRTSGQDAPPREDAPTAYLFDGWELNLVRLTLAAPDGTQVPLTSGEFSLLAALCARAGHVVSRDALLTRGDQAQPAAFDRSIDTLVGRVRRKLAAHGAGQDMIRTVRSAGYEFLPPVTARIRAAPP